jgi:hypothetical protein
LRLPSPDRPEAPDFVRGRRLALGYTGGLAIAAVASWLRVALTGTLRIDTGSSAFVICSLLLGAGLCAASICSWKLVRTAAGMSPWTLFRWAVPGHLLMALAAPITSSDFYQYVAYGLLDLAGKNPLAYGPSALGPTPLLDLISVRWLTQPSVYGPVMLSLFRFAAWAGASLGAPLWGTAIAIKLMMTAFTLLAVALAAAVQGPQREHATAIFAFSPLLAWELSGQGHSDAVLLLALICFVWAATAGNEWLAMLAITAGTLGKLTLAPILALYLLFLFRHRKLRAIAFGAGAIAFAAVLMLPYLQGFPGFGPLLGAVRSTRSHSLGDLLAVALSRFGPAAQDAAVRGTFVLCIGLCAVVFTAAAWRARTVHDFLRGCLLFLLAWDMTVPLFQSWYVAWLFPLALADPDRRWLRLVAIYGIFSVLQWTAQADPLSTVVLDGWVVWQAVRLLRTAGPANALAISRA